MARDQFSDLRKLYAVAMGVSLKTAQRHSEKGKPFHPDFQKFIGRTAAEGVVQKAKSGKMAPPEVVALASVSPLQPGTVPEFYDVPDDDLHPVQLNEKRAWQAHSQTFLRWQEYVGDSMNDSLTVVFVNLLPKLREDFEKARAVRDKWEVEMRMMVPIFEFQQFASTFIIPLAELLERLDSELASIANPDNPAFARKAIAEWKRDKIRPMIAALLEGKDEFQLA